MNKPEIFFNEMPDKKEIKSGFSRGYLNNWLWVSFDDVKVYIFSEHYFKNKSNDLSDKDYNPNELFEIMKSNFYKNTLSVIDIYRPPVNKWRQRWPWK